MTSRMRTLLWLVALTSMLAAGYWINRQIIWQEDELDIGYSELARKQQFLAAHNFLQRQGIDTQTVHTLRLLDNLSWQGQALAPEDTLIFLNVHRSVRAAQVTTLLTWIESGGTLIASTENNFISNSKVSFDLLFEELYLEVYDFSDFYDDESSTYNDADYDDDEYDDDEDEDEYEDQDEVEDNQHNSLDTNKPVAHIIETQHDEENKLIADSLSRCSLLNAPQEVALTQESEPLSIAYNHALRFGYYGDDEPYFSSGDDDGLYLARLNLGQGQVIVNSGNKIWTNSQIDCYDHAYLLWQLINTKGKVWFLVNHDTPSLWKLVWQSSPYGILAALIALLLWLWASALRFGPILTRTNHSRRSLGEHIHASATLLWRHQQHPYLITLLRTEIFQQCVRQAPLFNDWSRAQQAAYIQTLTQLTISEIERALFGEKLQSPQDFTDLVALLQTIRKSL